MTTTRIRLLLLWPLISCMQALAAPDSQSQYQLIPTGEVRYALRVTKAPVPKPEQGEVLLRVKAVSLNRLDIHTIDGMFRNQKRNSFVPVADGAGEVVEVGNGTTRFRVGDRVVPIFIRGWYSGRVMSPGSWIVGTGVNGMLTEYVTVREQDLLPIPEGLSFEEAATLPCAGLTAWNGIFAHGDLQRGDYVLIEGTGGIAVFGLQFAVAAGARPIVTSSSDEKLKQAVAKGAVGTVNYKTVPDWEVPVMKLTGGHGVDHVLAIGGSVSLPHAIATLASGGHVSLAGWVSGMEASIPMSVLINRDASVSGFHVGSKADFESMNAFIVQHGLKPVISRTFDFHDAQTAYDVLRSGEFFGKIVIRINPKS